MGKPIIMGRRTWNTLQKRPLDGRDNIVVTRDTTFTADGAHVVHGIDAAIDLGRRCAEARGAHEIMVIGGAEIYRAILDRVARIYLTRIDADPHGDTYFPHLNDDEWQTVSREEILRGDRDEFDASLEVLERR